MHNKINNDQSLISNLFGFMRLPLYINKIPNNFDMAIIGIPSDMTCTGKPGSKMAPSSIRESSINLFWEKIKWPWNFKLNKNFKVIDLGDLIFKNGNIEDLNKQIYKKVEELLKLKKKILFLGGDHYITLPILRMYKKFYKKISVIHFDAHTDTHNNKNIYDHGSVFYNIHKEKIISSKDIIQIGIRTYINKKKKFKIISSNKTNKYKVKKIINKILKIIKNKPTYLSFDIDCIDPSYVPGTGTPVINGIKINKIIKIIRKFKKINLIGIDIVEVSPLYDINNISSLTAANIALELIYTQAYIKKKNEKKTKR